MRNPLLTLAPTQVHLFTVPDRPEVNEALLNIFQLAPKAFEFVDGRLNHFNQVVGMLHEGEEALAKHV